MARFLGFITSGDVGFIGWLDNACRTIKISPGVPHAVENKISAKSFSWRFAKRKFTGFYCQNIHSISKYFDEMRELSHTARDWLRRLRRAGRAALHGASAAVEECRIRYELTACLKFKNAARFLSEWIEFHQMVGFEHFYLYNNNSTDDYRRALGPYCEEGSVTLYEWPDTPAFPKSDEHCLANHGHEARWIAFLDDDEFLFPVQGTDVRNILKRYQAYPALAVHWVMFGSSGHMRRPEGLVLENYLLRQQNVSPIIKSIVNPRRVAAAKTPHH
jgi:hypothetical protein